MKQCLRNSRRVPTSLVMSCKLWKCLSSFAITLTCYSLSWHEKYETWYLSILMQVMFCHIHSIQVTIILTFLVVFDKCLIFIFSICSHLCSVSYFSCDFSFAYLFCSLGTSESVILGVCVFFTMFFTVLLGLIMNFLLTNALVAIQLAWTVLTRMMKLCVKRL